MYVLLTSLLLGCLDVRDLIDTAPNASLEWQVLLFRQFCVIESMPLFYTVSLVINIYVIF